jgi:enoyl-CoA hydratase
MNVKFIDKVALVKFTTTQHFVTLSMPLVKELNKVLPKLDTMKKVGAIVLTGKENAFAAGANIKEMSSKTYP